MPQGTVTKDVWHSKVFPETIRDYWVYVPKQYDGSKPACVMVFQDGHRLRQRERRLPRAGRLRQSDSQAARCR